MSFESPKNRNRKHSSSQKAEDKTVEPILLELGTSAFEPYRYTALRNTRAHSRQWGATDKPLLLFGAA